MRTFFEIKKFFKNPWSIYNSEVQDFMRWDIKKYNWQKSLKIKGFTTYEIFLNKNWQKNAVISIDTGFKVFKKCLSPEFYDIF